jgi:hypothetical protein
VDVDGAIDASERCESRIFRRNVTRVTDGGQRIDAALRALGRAHSSAAGMEVIA